MFRTDSSRASSRAARHSRGSRGVGAGPGVVRGSAPPCTSCKNGWTFIICRTARSRPCSRSPRRPTSAPRRIRRGRPAWRTCSSTWRSRARPVVGTSDYAKEKAGARGDGEGLSGTAQRARDAPQARQGRSSRSCTKAVRGEASRRAAVRQAERVRRADRARGRRRLERRHQLRPHGLLLRAAVQQVRAVRLSRIGALLAAGVPRVLQGARRRHRRAPHADREPADRPAVREVRRGAFTAHPYGKPAGRLSQRSRSATR